MRLIHRPLLVAVLHFVKHPRRVLLIAGLVLVACVGMAAWKLRIATDQNRLFDPRVAFFRAFINFNKNFPENEAIYVVIQRAAPAGQQIPVSRWTDLADQLTERLRAMPQYVKSVDSRVPIDKLGAQGLLFDAPSQVHEHFQDIKRFIPLVQIWGEKPGALARVLGATPLERFISAVKVAKPSEETASFVGILAHSWNQVLTHADQPASMFVPNLNEIAATDPSMLGYYYVADESDVKAAEAEHREPHKLMLVRIYHRTTYNSLTAISNTVSSIRKAVEDVARGFPEFNVGITGRPALEADEMLTTHRDARRAEVIALIAVFIGLMVMLRSFWLALAGELALGVGIGWTFGWATISIGELNLLSIVFLLALIGIGMDYLVQILTRYRQEVARRNDPELIWISVFRHVAPPINTACLGAAGAFFVSNFTHFRGAAQLGIIAGGGLLLCLLAGYVVLPTLLTIFPLKVKRGDQLPNLGPPAQAGRMNLVQPGIWASLLIIGIPFMMRTDFDPGLITLQSPNLQSVALVRKLQTWSAVVLSKDLDTLRTARNAVENSPQVQRTESILDAYDNLAWLGAHQNELPKIAWNQPDQIGPDDLGRIATKARALAEAYRAFPDAARELDQFAAELGRAPAERAASRLTDWQASFIDLLKRTLAPFYPTGLDLEKLPPELRSHFIGVDGSFALYIYPKSDLWDQGNLRAFVRDIESRMSGVRGQFTLTGIALNIYHSTASIEQSFYRAAAYALILIIILVFIDLRHIGQTLLAISVLAMGLPMLTAIMGLMGANWNFANFFALPILIGAGHEYGVFLVHRYREALHDPRRVWRRWDVSDRALLLCAYVTCTSFGFFWFLAHHGGLRSLGLVMTLGTASIYLSSIMVLRPILLWILRRKARSIESTQDPGRPLNREVVNKK